MCALKPGSTAIVGRPSILSKGIALLLDGSDYKVGYEIEELSSEANPLLSAEPYSLFIVVREETGLEKTERAVEYIRRISPSSLIVVLSVDDVPSEAELQRVSGVNGWLPLSIGPKGLVSALDIIVSERVKLVITSGDKALPQTSMTSHDLYSPTGRGSAVRDGDGFDDLYASFGRATGKNISDREYGVLQSLIRGESNKYIARKLSISEATVKIHVRSILRKIGAENRTQAAIWLLNERSASVPCYDHKMAN